jgi:hypothetical protein
MVLVNGVLARASGHTMKLYIVPLTHHYAIGVRCCRPGFIGSGPRRIKCSFNSLAVLPPFVLTYDGI